ncbi:MAG: hypothetical protein IKP88_21775 [Lachnospiraceae bacterium]|jgi:hypothetical protein|nr:hypothetical protein [Lachnospiraceae bacterium]
MLTILALLIGTVLMGLLWFLLSPIGGVIILALVIGLIVYKIVKKKKE